MCCRCRSDPVLLWLWCRPLAAALIQPLAQELPSVVGVAVKRKKKVNINRLIKKKRRVQKQIYTYESAWFMITVAM